MILRKTQILQVYTYNLIFVLIPYAIVCVKFYLYPSLNC